MPSLTLVHWLPSQSVLILVSPHDWYILYIYTVYDFTLTCTYNVLNFTIKCVCQGFCYLVLNKKLWNCSLNWITWIHWFNSSPLHLSPFLFPLSLSVSLSFYSNGTLYWYSGRLGQSHDSAVILSFSNALDPVVPVSRVRVVKTLSLFLVNRFLAMSYEVWIRT